MAFDPPDGYRWTSEPFGLLVLIKRRPFFTRSSRAFRAFWTSMGTDR